MNDRIVATAAVILTAGGGLYPPENGADLLHGEAPPNTLLTMHGTARGGGGRIFTKNRHAEEGTTGGPAGETTKSVMTTSKQTPSKICKYLAPLKPVYLFFPSSFLQSALPTPLQPAPQAH